jgi:hypothetical protein
MATQIQVLIDRTEATRNERLFYTGTLRLIIGGTSAWLAFATWITQWS